MQANVLLPAVCRTCRWYNYRLAAVHSPNGRTTKKLTYRLNCIAEITTGACQTWTSWKHVSSQWQLGNTAERGPCTRLATSKYRDLHNQVTNKRADTSGIHPGIKLAIKQYRGFHWVNVRISLVGRPYMGRKRRRTSTVYFFFFFSWTSGRNASGRAVCVCSNDVLSFPRKTPRSQSESWE